jgi:GNAT superfamily N-acetyltransferase
MGKNLLDHNASNGVSAPIKLRQALVSEANDLCNLAIRSKAIWGYEEEFLQQCRQWIKIDKEYIEKWPVVVLEKNNEIKGFYSLKKINEENRLDNLWIEPKFVRCGYGQILFQDAIEVARTLKWNHFRLAGEPKAVVFYKKMGARLIGSVQSRLKADLFLPHMEYDLNL